ncbi:outer membrane protein OmpU [Paracoccus pantotrophus]|nr:porin [Paracoccus pantotrophus]RKS50857.1 outer membrane protein OmpU [Paracoccus pantotrophus]
MKKALIASTALLLTAGVAAAEVSISGYGRTGVVYIEDRPGNETRVDSRLRMNIDASTSTDSGVDFGARFRLQWDQDATNGQGESAATNAGKLWISAQGLTVEVGNVDNAYDSSTLLFAPELGVFDFNAGARNGSYFAYESNPYADVNRQGVGVRYSFDALTLRASYIDPDQSGVNEVLEEEFSILAQYTWNDRLELEGAYTVNGAGVDENDIFFVGARYAVMENARIGLNYVDASNDSAEDDGNTITLYGDYTLADGRTNLEAFIANNDHDANESDNAFGIGVNYDLGGARLGASIQRDYAEKVRADMGVRFEF